MIIADNRLVSLTPTWSQTLSWPPAEPYDSLDYYVDVTVAMEDVTDSVASFEVSVAPSGDGELQPSNTTFSGFILCAWLSGGVPGRAYTIKMLVETVGGRRFTFLVGLSIALDSLVTTPRPPISPGFGAPVTA